MIKLSKRLQQVANMVPKNSRVVDIGSDHAYIPIYLVQQGIIRSAIASAITSGPRAISKSDIAESEGISFSSLTGDGISSVVEAIVSYLTKESRGAEDVPVIESERQERKLGETVEALKEAEQNSNESVDIIALFFQSALSSLSELTGETTSDDILEVLFSSFCLGK